MNNRRKFLKTGALLSVATLTACTGVNKKDPDLTSSVNNIMPLGIIYTRARPGKWKNQVGGHVPIIIVSENHIKIETEHGMSKRHYIVRHTLVSSTGKVLGTKTFSPSDDEAISIFKKPQEKAELYATSFCNKHDMWVEKFTV